MWIFVFLALPLISLPLLSTLMSPLCQHLFYSFCLMLTDSRDFQVNICSQLTTRSPAKQKDLFSRCLLNYCKQNESMCFVSPHWVKRVTLHTCLPLMNIKAKDGLSSFEQYLQSMCQQVPPLALFSCLNLLLYPLLSGLALQLSCLRINSWAEVRNAH